MVFPKQQQTQGCVTDLEYGLSLATLTPVVGIHDGGLFRRQRVVNGVENA